MQRLVNYARKTYSSDFGAGANDNRASTAGIKYERRTSASAGRSSQDQKLETVGSLPLRTSMGHCSRRLFGGKRSLALFTSRTRAESSLPLGRRWITGDHGSRVPALLRTRHLERSGPYLEGTSVWTDGPGRKPWGGRQGMLFLSRFIADSFLPESALQVSASSFSVRRTGLRESSAGLSLPEYEIVDTGVFEDNRYFDVFAEYAKQ